MHLTLKKLSIFLLTVFIGFSAMAQTSRANTSTKQVISEKTTTGALARAITKNSKSDAEKVQAIFYWIATNISYDHELQNSRSLQQEIYRSEENVIKNVLQRKNALCGGYAFLFKELCERVGISSEVIHGYSKKYSVKVAKDPKVDHSWNAVKLNGKWQLLDVNWAVSQKLNSGINTYWYLTRPEHFIYTHYPEDPRWTLLKHPPSRSEFLGASK